MSENASSAPDHGVRQGGPSLAPALAPIEPAPRLSAAEEARTLVAGSTVAALATLTSTGDPWASLTAYGLLADGSPVLCLSHLAEHGRNLLGDARASLLITSPEAAEDPLAAGRVTLLGRARRAADAASNAALRAAHLASVPAAIAYIDFSDFSLWTLSVERVRWVGGYGRMDTAAPADYAAAAPDPVAVHAGSAIDHLNSDHPEALLLIGQQLGGHPDATVARCSGIDCRGIDLALETPRGHARTRVAFSGRLAESAEVRAATVELVRQAREAAAQG